MRRVLLLGAYDEKHTRLIVIRKALESQGFAITKWNIKSGMWLQYLRFFIRSPKIARDALRCHFILVPYPGWKSMVFAKIMSSLTRRKLIFDAFISSYNTFIEDRKYFHPKSAKALYHLMRDRVTCRLADIVLLDTEAHIRYFSMRFALPISKFVRVFVGVDYKDRDTEKDPRPQSEKSHLVFVGTLITRHGTRYIIRALNILAEKGLDFRFTLIGTGQESRMIDSMIKELKLEPFVERYSFIPYERLLDFIDDADICFGIFGNTGKAKMVIPTKMFDYAALDKVIITGDSAAVQELFTEGTDYIGCSFADEIVLAEKIQNTIQQLSKLQSQLNPQRTIIQFATPERIGIQLVRDLKEQGV